MHRHGSTTTTVMAPTTAVVATVPPRLVVVVTPLGMLPIVSLSLSTKYRLNYWTFGSVTPVPLGPCMPLRTCCFILLSHGVQQVMIMDQQQRVQASNNPRKFSSIEDFLHETDSVRYIHKPEYQLTRGVFGKPESFTQRMMHKLIIIITATKTMTRINNSNNQMLRHFTNTVWWHHRTWNRVRSIQPCKR